MSARAPTTRHALLVTRNLPPLRGGMERLNLSLALALAARCSLSISGPAGCRRYVSEASSAVYETRPKPLPVFLAGCLISALRIARRARPDIVLAGSGLTAPIAWVVSRMTGARLVVYVHGLDVVVQSFLYQHIWVPFIRRADLILANSRNTGKLAERAGVASTRIRILSPGTGVPGHDPAAGRAFRETEGLGEAPLLLSVGRLTSRKGVAEFVTHALPVILKSVPDAVLLVIGDEARDAVRRDSESEVARIERLAEAAGVHSALRCLQHCDDGTLSAAYDAADVHIFPVLDRPGDVEGFGMVAIEAAAHGLPTVAFDVGGVADAVVNGVTGSLIEAGNYSAMAAAVVSAAVNRFDLAARARCVEAARGVSLDSFRDRLHALLEQ